MREVQHGSHGYMYMHIYLCSVYIAGWPGIIRQWELDEQ